MTLAHGYDELGFNNIYNQICDLFEDGYSPEEAFMLLGLN